MPKGYCDKFVCKFVEDDRRGYDRCGKEESIPVESFPDFDSVDALFSGLDSEGVVEDESEKCCHEDDVKDFADSDEHGED